MKIFCSGIGGIGLSAYASLQRNAGHDVSGSDRSWSALLDDLQSQGIAVSTDQSGKAIPEACDLLVYSEAIPADAPERTEAQRRGIMQMSYPQALGELSKNHTVIAVCGTHGKSSTTAMAARLLMDTGKDPTVVVGTKLRELDGRNWRQGKSDLFLLEACEYRKSFSFYSPSMILMTNVDGDHFDYYASVEEYRSSFSAFIARLPDDGTLITHLKDPDCKAIADASGKKTVDADAFELIELKTPGLHMRQNAQLVLALADVLAIPRKEATAAVSGYAGSWRRMEEKGRYKNTIPVIDDYAHHPAEIRATLAALKERYGPKRLVCVFQPHTHDRTLKLYDDFLGAFADAGLLIVSDVYEARKDIETAKVDMPAFIKDIAAASNVNAVAGGSLKTAEALIDSTVIGNDVIVCLGAGDITNLAGKLAGK